MSSYPSLMSRSPREEVVHGLHKAADLARRIMLARHTGMGLQDLEDELDELLDYFDSRTYLGAKALLEANDKKRVAEEEATLRRRIWDFSNELSKGPANAGVAERYRHVESLLAELDRAFALAERPVNQSPLPSRVEIIRTADVDIMPDPKLWVEAIKGALPPNDYARVAEALALVTKHLERLNKKIAALGAGPSVIPPANLTLDGGTLDSIRQPVGVTSLVLATEASLAKLHPARKLLGAKAIATDSTGIKLSYTVPAGKAAEVVDATWRNITGNPTVVLQVDRGGGLEIGMETSATGDIHATGVLILEAGDSVQWNVRIAAVATSTADASFSIREFTA